MQFFRIYFWFILYKIGVVNNPEKISKAAFSFISGMETDKLDYLTKDFFETILKDKIYIEGKEKILWHLKMKHDLLLLTNAIEPIAKIMAQYLNIPKYLCTKLENIDNIYTGKILGANTYGRNKVLKILSYVKEHDCNIKKTWAYCDHGSDIDIMSVVKYPIAVNPDKTLKKESDRRGWKIINFKNK
jgi:HAD superfamily hydrolase (TIGR01490 family)